MSDYPENVRDNSLEEISQNPKKTSNKKHTEYVNQVWMKKIESGSRKYRPILCESFKNNICEVPLEAPVMYHSPKQKDLKTVILEFENNFLKPTNVDTSNSSTKDKSFVKRIVAAFEEKCKTSNESKIEDDVRTILENREIFLEKKKLNQSGASYSSDLPKENLNTFGNTSKICHLNSNKVEDESYVLFDSPDIKKHDQKNKSKTIWTSPFKSSIPKESKLMKMLTYRYNPDEELASVISDDELDQILEQNLNATSTPFKTLKNELNPNDNEERNAEIPEENVPVFNKENSMIEEVKIVASTSKHNRTINNLKRESVEEEKNNVVDSTPYVEKERSRRKILKKLFSKFIHKKSKNVFVYENVKKYQREFQDSGYSEISSSPLNASMSASNTTSFRKKLYPSKWRKLAAQKSLIDDIKDEKIKNEEEQSIKKSDLNEASEEIIRLDITMIPLGKVTEEPMSSTYCSFSASTTPEYLYFADTSNNSSVTVTDNTDNTSTNEVCLDNSLSASITENCSDSEIDGQEEFKKLEYSQNISTKFFSQSESKINELRIYNDSNEEEFLFNYRRSLTRSATNSFYEDVVSLRRRIGSLPNFYSCPEHYNPLYATIKRGHKCKFCDYDRQRLSKELDLCTSL